MRQIEPEIAANLAQDTGSNILHSDPKSAMEGKGTLLYL